MQAINSTVKILLIDNDLASSVNIESHLASIKSDLIQLIKIRHSDDIANLLQSEYFDLIFYIFNSSVNSNLNSNLICLSRLQVVNLDNIPIVLFATDKNIDSASLPIVLDDCLILAEISPDSLSKSIFFALKRAQQNRDLNSLKQENSELSSQLIATKNLFQTIIDNTSTLVWMCDAKGNPTFFNQAWSRVLGGETPELNSSWMLNIHSQDLANCESKFQNALAQEKGFKINYRLKIFNQKCRWISNYAVPQFTVEGEFKGLVGYCFDITSLKKTERKLIQRAASDRLLVQITQKIHASLELEQILQTTVDEVKQFLLAEKIQINRVEATGNLTLLVESRLIDSPLSCDIAEPKQLPITLFANNIRQLSAGKSVSQDFTVQSFSASGGCATLLVPIITEAKLWGLITIENCSLPRRWRREEINLLERIALELSVAIRQTKLYQQLEQANRELQQLSVMDGLTHIANRRKFDQYLAREWIRLSREKNPLSLILCDIDHFKLYNDTYGHQAGDRCLIEVAQAISKVVKRPMDLVARYGGEEFVLVLPQTDLRGAKYLAQKIRLQVETLKIPHLSSSVDLYVTISLGVSCCIPNPDYDFEVLIAAADQGLYQAKEMGRNQAVECEIELYN